MPSRDIRLLGLALVTVIAASVLGQIATGPNLAPWYASLEKPSFTPPNGVFAPVWTVLFLLMATALWRILRLPVGTGGRRRALFLFIAQLAFNVAWSWMFFAAQSPLLGLINILPQFALILAVILSVYHVDRIAAFCLVPLLFWVGFAGALNFAIWQLNG